ncbi:MAG: PQQ-dependent sugar dehydrogenase [Burkholderiaceae bacterium]|nr:PQQ-dependent sugar dehydrogenase [Burkholderiaceae bacterium]MDP4969394.1 PQQ-dependent sugar dehydrogenase [Burkholderiaceae bacterium]MDP5111383.1 PQQ-dependent sugar dehydrogenase [Burkholderiaceae bacterium]
MNRNPPIFLLIRLGGFLIIALLLASAFCTKVNAQVPEVQSEKHAFRATTLASGLENPWSVAFLPDNRMLVTERAGRLRILDPNFKLDPKPIEGLPEIMARGQGGLFDVVLHPDYLRNGWIYWAYSAPGAGGWGTALARGKLRGHQMTEVQVLFTMEPKTRSGQHFGGRIVFDQSGMLYLTLGDRGDKDRAQDLNDHAGSVIRLHDDGRVPVDNPFALKNNAKPEKWTLGNRNIQGAAIHPQSGALWTHEHGPQGGDEINVMRAGRNYGWPVITYGVNYGSGSKIGEGQTKAGMEQPLHMWVPSIAPSGLAFVNSDKFPHWKGNLLIGALRDQSLVRLELDGEKVLREERMLKGQLGRIRDVRMGPDGLVYLLTDSTQGALIRLEPIDP